MMLLDIAGSEYFNDKTQEFFYTEPCQVKLEHSLLAVSKWESKWKTSFLSEREMRKMTSQQLADYFICMEVEPPTEPRWVFALTPVQTEAIIKYISEEQTATTFYSFRKDRTINNKTITSELIYYWMVSLGIPFACETWHLSRLLTLIHVASIKGQTGKKMSKLEIMKSNAELNEERKRKYHTRG